MGSPPTDRVRHQLKLALLSDCGCMRTLENARSRASEAGLCGAEVEAAILSRSFDIRTSAIIAVACALKAGNAAGLGEARNAAVQLGWSSKEIASFEALALEIIASHWPTSKGGKRP